MARRGRTQKRRDNVRSGDTTRGTVTRGTSTRGTRGRSHGRESGDQDRWLLPAFFFRFQGPFGRAAQWARETMTVGGWFLISAVLFALLVGWPLNWLPLVVAGIVGLVLILIALLFLIGGKSFEVDVRVDKERVMVGSPLGGALQVKNAGRAITLPAILSLPVGAGMIEIGIPFLRSGNTFSQDLQVPTDRRAVIEVGPPLTARSSPLGIFVRETLWADSQTVYVYPKTITLPPTIQGLIRDLEGDPRSKIVRDDLSFHAIREYQPGDQRRHIHWKSTAKTGQLMVRQYEETVRSEMLIVLPTRADEFAEEEEFELAVSVAGSFGVRALHDGRNVRFMSGLPRSQFAGSNIRAVATLATRGKASLLDDLAGVQASENANRLRELVDEAADASRSASIGVLVVGSAVSVADLRAATLSFGSDMALLAIKCDRYAKPSIRMLADITVVTVAVLDDLRHLMMGRAQR